MKKIFVFGWMMTVTTILSGQPNIVPAKVQAGTVAIFGATIHTGAGQVINSGTIVFSKGKITSVQEGKNVPQGDVTAIDATGKHIYPGFIAMVTNLGLAEFAMVKSTVDFQELGNFNPHVRSIIAYNAESKAIPVVRSNGILMAQTSPSGGLIAGQSSVVQLDAWIWEDAAYKTDEGIQFEWQALHAGDDSQGKLFQEFSDFMRQAKAYAESANHEDLNARFEAMRGLFAGKKKAYVSADSRNDIIEAVQFFKGYGITPVIVGGAESGLALDFLKGQHVPVIIHYTHMLPGMDDADVYSSAKLAAQLQQAGITFAISMEFVRNWGYLQLRNLPFEAGLTAAYGLSKEQALSAITLNAAKILGIDNKCGSLEAGKDATLFISGGDALDMMTNDVQRAYIQGREINLDNFHKQLNKRFSEKYELK